MQLLCNIVVVAVEEKQPTSSRLLRFAKSISVGAIRSYLKTFRQGEYSLFANLEIYIYIYTHVQRVYM